MKTGWRRGRSVSLAWEAHVTGPVDGSLAESWISARCRQAAGGPRLRLAPASGRAARTGQVQGPRASSSPGPDQGAPAARAGRRDMLMKTTDHICAAHAICFQCFKAGADRTRARREAWAQRSLPFDAAPGGALAARDCAPAADAGAPGAGGPARLTGRVVRSASAAQQPPSARIAWASASAPSTELAA